MFAAGSKKRKAGSGQQCSSQFKKLYVKMVRHICRYFGPLPPSLGVHLGPSTSVALQSMQLAGLTTNRSPSRS